MVVTAAVLLFALLSGCCKCTRTLLIATIPETGSVPSTSHPFNASFRTGSDDLPDQDERIVPPKEKFDPEQLHLIYYGEQAVLVSWVTGQGEAGPNVSKPAHPPPRTTLVRYGSQKQLLEARAYGWEQTYLYNYNFPGAWNYSSAVIHHALIEGLNPLQTYFYKVGNPKTNVWSDVYNFTTLPRAGDRTCAIRIGFMADVGQTYNSSGTLQHMLHDEPDLVVLVGDFSYADDYQSNGALDPWVTNSSVEPPPGDQRPVWGTYQHRWDTWGRLSQPLASHIPFLVNTGNHEIERQSDRTQFASYLARYPPPHRISNSPSPLFYSMDAGLVHLIFLTSYTDFDKHSKQYQWLKKDLQQVDRRKTPWLVVTFHAPWYNTYVAHYKENECMRIAMEPLLYKYGVDLVFSGHTHAYERSNPVYNYTVDTCGPVYVTIGDGGNIEHLAIHFADEEGLCPDPERTPPWEQPQKCVTFQKGRYCPSQQPSWSAFREPSFGHGILHVYNASHAEWHWNRNQDEVKTVSDRVIFVQDRKECLHKELGGAATSAAGSKLAQD